MGFIDADTHVLETNDTWDYLDPSDRDCRPLKVEFLDPPSGTTAYAGISGRRIWVADDAWTREHPNDGRPGGYGKDFGVGKTDLADPGARIQEMDALGVDVQLLISTFFISMDLDHPRTEAALTRSFNRWMGERTAGTGGRLPWLVVPPTRSLDRSLEELRYGKSHGAVGVMIKGIDHGMYLNDPFLYPLYAEAQELDLAMCVHVGAHSRRSDGQPFGVLFTNPAGLLNSLSTLMKGFWAVLASDLYKRFPRLRWCFLEAGSTWVPAIFQQHQRLMSTSSDDGWLKTERGTIVDISRLPVGELMQERNMYVSCQNDEELSYLNGITGGSQLVFGTDYGHNDVGADPIGHSVLMGRSDMDYAAKRAIVDGNGRRMLAIPDSFTPASALIDRS